jgi:hypothetical protein
MKFNLFCRLFILIALIFPNVRANAQPYPFGEQISRFRQQDSISFPERRNRGDLKNSTQLSWRVNCT